MKLSRKLKKTMAALQEIYDEGIDERREKVVRNLREKYPEKNLYEHIANLECSIEGGINSKWLWKEDVYELMDACRIDGYDYSGLHDAGFKF